MDTNEMLELSQEFALLATELHGAGDNQAALRRIVELAVEHVDGCNWASITVMRGSQGHSMAVSDEVAQLVDGLQYQSGEGPGMAAVEKSADYLCFDLEDEPRWPQFARAVTAQSPVRSMLAFRLTAGRAVALNLYADQPGAFSSDAVDIATIFAAHASCLIALHEAEDQAANLEAALESNRIIGVALGVLMSARKVPQEQAFTLLRVASQTLHRKLRSIAAEVAETGTLPDLPAAKSPTKAGPGAEAPAYTATADLVRLPG
jgi:GAF domain-containing protein